MSKPVQAPYTPLLPPQTEGNEDLTRYLYEELTRIKEALAADPVALTVSETSVITVTTVINWQRIFILALVNWDYPGGTWDNIAAEWTCPQVGLYSFTVDLRVEPYGAGNKNYYAGIRLNIVRADGSGTDTLESIDSGDDNFMLGVTLPAQLVIFSGDVVYVTATVVHDQFIGDATINSSMQIHRISA